MLPILAYMEELVTRLSVPTDLARSYLYYQNDERSRIENPETRKCVTAKELMLQTLENQARKMGHYPPKTGAVADSPKVQSDSDILVGS